MVRLEPADFFENGLKSLNLGNRVAVLADTSVSTGTVEGLINVEAADRRRDVLLREGEMVMQRQLKVGWLRSTHG